MSLIPLASSILHLLFHWIPYVPLNVGWGPLYYLPIVTRRSPYTTIMLCSCLQLYQNINSVRGKLLLMAWVSSWASLELVLPSNSSLSLTSVSPVGSKTCRYKFLSLGWYHNPSIGSFVWLQEMTYSGTYSPLLEVLGRVMPKRFLGLFDTLSCSYPSPPLLLPSPLIPLALEV